MIRGKEITCSERVVTKIFEKEKMVLLYQFALEIAKSKNSLNLNFGHGGETDEHIVTMIASPEVQSPVERGGIFVEYYSRLWYD